MLTKENVLKSIEALPDSFTIDQLIDQLLFIEKVQEGLKQSEEGRLVSNEDIKRMIEKWSN